MVIDGRRFAIGVSSAPAGVGTRARPPRGTPTSPLDHGFRSPSLPGRSHLRRFPLLSPLSATSAVQFPLLGLSRAFRLVLGRVTGVPNAFLDILGLLRDVLC